MEAEEERLAREGTLSEILRLAELNLRNLAAEPPLEDRGAEVSAGCGVVRLVREELRLRLRTIFIKLFGEEPSLESMERASDWERFELLFLRPKLAAEKPLDGPPAPGMAGAR